MPDRPDPTPGVTPLGLPSTPNPAGEKTIEVMTGPRAHGAPIVVSSDAMLVQVEALDRLSESLRLTAGGLLSVMERDTDALSISAEIPFAAIEARRVMAAAFRALEAAQARAAHIRDGVVTANRNYARGERVAMLAMHAVGEGFAWALGQALRVVGLPLGVLALEDLAVVCLVFRLTPADVARDAQTLLRLHPRILTNSFTVDLIRETAADVDGFSAGLTGVPLPVATPLQDGGITGVHSSAEEVVLIGETMGLFRETPVSVRRTTSWVYSGAPTSLVDRASAFPDAHVDANGEQIRIDRYVEPGKPDRYDVYVAGTVTFDPKATTQPFDFTSDMRGVAGQTPASVRAVEEAMAGAGITASTPVVLNGYSQGGLVASMVAASGSYDVKGVVTFGAPSAQVRLPAGIPVLSVRNSEDLVPATSGYDVNPHAVIVQRSAYASAPIPTERTVPGHLLEAYQQTAAVVDSSNSPQVRAVLDPINAFGAGATHIQSSLWVATRTPTDTIDTGVPPAIDARLKAAGAVGG